MAKTVAEIAAEIADGFIASVVEPTAPNVQKVEMRKAFMSGFLAALLDIDKIANSHDEAEAAHMLDAYHKELLVHFKVHWRSVKKGN